ncbi:ALP1-like protein [Tanacetum coccineum]
MYTSAICQLAYGTVPDAFDEYLQMGNATSRQCKAPEVPFVANGVTYPWGYHLCDGIYQECVPFVKTVTNLADDDYKRLQYKTMHEAARKDVERAFDVLKKKWAILASPARAYIKEILANIMYTCIILHNMIIKDCKEAISPK